MQEHISTVHSEHKKIEQLAVPIIKSAKAGDASLLHYEIEKALGKLVPLVMSHFMLEENILYPALILNNKAADIIDEMLLIQKEHGMLEQQFKHVIYLVKMTSPEELTADSKLSQLLITTTLELYNSMTEHQKHEDTLFNSYGIS